MIAYVIKSSIGVKEKEYWEELFDSEEKARRYLDDIYLHFLKQREYYDVEPVFDRMGRMSQFTVSDKEYYQDCRIFYYVERYVH